jgi:hypothetical protein
VVRLNLLRSLALACATAVAAVTIAGASPRHASATPLPEGAVHTGAVTSVSVGGTYACAVLEGTAFCWGSQEPVAIDGLTQDVSAILSRLVAHLCPAGGLALVLGRGALRPARQRRPR